MNTDVRKIADILAKSKQLRRLSVDEVSALLDVEDDETLQEIFRAAKELKEAIYGKRLVIFTPLYISNYCLNDCLYCAFRSSNKEIVRKRLDQDEIRRETEIILQSGQKRVLLVAGEGALDYVLKSIETIYAARDGKNNIRRLNVNIAPLQVKDFQRLKQAQIGTYQLFQEVYHRPTYEKMHPSGPKSDYDYHYSVMDRAFKAGIDDVGLGILFGLYDYKYEVLALMKHVEHLEKEFGLGPHTISVPRLEPAAGSAVAVDPPYPVSDRDFKKIIAVLRLAVPYTGIILSTRENAEMRRAAFELGISQISAGSRTSPGGYSNDESQAQFSLGDHRPLDEVVYDICQQGYIPSFCTGCYRLGRTGLDFMEYAKPGEIKAKCLPNAVVTFQEYLEDYASEKTRAIGRKIIQEAYASCPDQIKGETMAMLDKVKHGERDLFV